MCWLEQLKMKYWAWQNEWGEKFVKSEIIFVHVNMYEIGIKFMELHWSSNYVYRYVPIENHINHVKSTL